MGRQGNKNAMVHGFSRERLYRCVWKAMKQRCYDKNYHGYNLYGGRGITVCDEWRDNYITFRQWALENGYDANAPYGECTIDRIDVNGNYEPSNCRIVNMKVQSNNKREGLKTGRYPWKYYEYKGSFYTCKQLAKMAGIKESTMRMRLVGEGMTVEEAITLKHNEHRNGTDIQKTYYRDYAI